MISGQWLTVQDVAELLQVRIETVRRWVRRGELPVLELGGPRTVYRIRPDDLDRFVWQRYRSSGDGPEDGEAEAIASDHDANATSLGTSSGDDPGATAAESSSPVAMLGEYARSFVDRVPAVTFREDPARQAVPAYMSREIETLLGFPLEEWSSDPEIWHRHIHPADRETVMQELSRTDATGEPFNMEYRMIRRDGQTIWIQIEAALVPDEDGGSMVWEGVIVDVTERKRIESALGLRKLQQQAVADLGRDALEGRSLSTLLEHAVAYATRSLDVEYAKIFEVLPGGERLVMRAGIGWHEGQIGRSQIPMSGVDTATVTAEVDSQAGFTLRSNQPVVSEDLENETRFDGASMARLHGVCSGVSVIIPGRGRPFGVFGAHSTRLRSFTQDDVFFLQSLANVLASVVVRTDTRWMTVTDVAEFLQVTEETVRRWIRRSELPALNLGGPRAGYRVYPSDLERFITDRIIRM